MEKRGYATRLNAQAEQRFVVCGGSRKCLLDCKAVHQMRELVYVGSLAGRVGPVKSNQIGAGDRHLVLCNYGPRNSTAKFCFHHSFKAKVNSDLKLGYESRHSKDVPMCQVYTT